MTIEESFTAARQFVEARFASYPPEACAVLIAAYVNATGGKVAAPAKQAKKQMEVEPLPDGPDQVAQFVAVECVIDVDALVRSQTLYRNYLRWASEQNITRPLSTTLFSHGLKGLGYRHSKKTRYRYFAGLRLRKEPEPENA